MKTSFHFRRTLLFWLAILCSNGAMSGRSSAQSLADGLVAYWPLDVVVGGKTPDVVGGYDLSPYVGPAHTLTNGDAITLTAGYRSNCVSFVAANRVLLGYVAGANDELPINQHPALTIAFWVNAPAGQNDLRMFSEGNINNNNPLFNIGTSSSGGGIDLFFRQQPTPAELAAGYGNFGAGSHLVTGGAAYDNTWHQVVLVQQVDGTRTIYIDAVADSLGLPVKPEGLWNVNATSIGGILRASAAAWSTALIDEVALWKRALSQEEIQELRNDGVPRVIRRRLPLQIRSFTADQPTVVQGDRVVLAWDASADAALAIAPGIGDVTAVSQFGVGTTSVVVSADTTFTLTATRASESTNRQVSVKTVSGVAAGWRIIENFEFLPPGHIGGRNYWQNALSSISGALNPANVVDTEAGNQFLGFSGENVLAGRALNSMTIPEGQTATLFLRFYIFPETDTGGRSDIDINLGLTEKGLRDVQDFRGGNNGPSVRLFRQGGGPINLTANNGVNGANGTYSFIADSVNNPSGAGLEPGKVYNLWMDVENRSFGVVGGVQTGGDLYSVHLQKEGDPARLTLFEGYVSDRDAVNIDVVLGAPGTSLTHLFMCANNQVLPQQANKVRFDDFFLSTGGFNATVPTPAGSFQTPIRIHSIQYDASMGFTFRWNAIPGKTYTINRKLALQDAWTPAVSEYPFGGALDSTVEFLDIDAPFYPSAFYQVVEEP
ncbi:MAG TPA: LamG domain-containing protein [Methylomirabilota bacterium]|nr:LamG domain-containing protein [Methylomirabilota bacterium]